jgi:hypothetical protein
MIDKAALKKWLEQKRDYSNKEFHSAKDNNYIHLSTYEMGKRDAFHEVITLIKEVAGC